MEKRRNICKKLKYTKKDRERLTKFRKEVGNEKYIELDKRIREEEKRNKSKKFGVSKEKKF